MISDFVDKIIYINLDRRPDRRREIEQELNNFDLSYERFTAIDYPGFGIYGCGMSHLNVLKLAKERQYKNVLIFEDDFKFIVSKNEFDETINSLFREPTDNQDNQTNMFDVCMFSYIIEKQEPNNNFTNFNRAISATTASGYLVQSHYYDTLIDLYSHYIPLLLETREHWNYANDQIWKKLQIKDKWLISNKRIGIQRPSFSDNSNCFQEYNY
jgi:glycosyl transferase family 25